MERAERAEHADQGSPLPADPAGREDIMSDEQARRDVSPGRPEGRPARVAGESSPLPSDPARREDVIREHVIREDVVREDFLRDTEQPGGPAAG